MSLSALPWWRQQHRHSFIEMHLNNTLETGNTKSCCCVFSLQIQTPQAPLPLRSLKVCSVITSVDSEPLQESGFVINFLFSLFLVTEAESSSPSSTPVSQGKCSLKMAVCSV